MRRPPSPARRLALSVALAWTLAPAVAHATEEVPGEGAPVVLALAIILVVAKLAGDLAVRLKQPSVLGELVGGIAIGALPLLGVDGFAWIGADPFVDLLAKLGVIVLLFEVGLESTVAQMMKVGWVSAIVAVVGVLAPFALGFGVGRALLPGHSVYMHVFLGATLTATSVGITARVLQDLGRSQTPEARVILGAAVIDDVLGLVVLAVVAGAIEAADRGGALSIATVAIILAKSSAFLVGSLVLGVWLSPRAFDVASRLQTRGVLLALGLAFCFLLAWLAHAIGLAPIVGAFAAGLILEDAHYRSFVDRGEHGLEELVAPISSFLAPVFFVLMGMRTDLRAFASPGALVLAGALVVVAVAGKLVCGLVVPKRQADRLAVGIGMIPRGEVGLIFANLGLTLRVEGEPVVDPSTFSAMVVMVVATTMLTPPALAWALGRVPPRAGAAA